MAGTKRFLQPIRSILESSKSGILIVRADGRIYFMNETMEQHSGCTYTAVRGKPLHVIFPDTDAKDLYRHTNGKTLPKKIRLKTAHANGRSTVPVFISRIIEQTRLDGYLLIVQSRTNGEAAAHFQKDRHSILRVMDRREDEACSITNIQTGEDHFMSLSIKSLTGWDRENFLTGGFSFGMSLIHPDDVQDVMRIYEREIERRNREPFLHDHQQWNVGFRYRQPDGNFIRLSAETMILERDEQLRVRLVMTTFRKFESEKRSNPAFQSPLTEEAIRIIDGKPFIDIEFLNKLRSHATGTGTEQSLPDLSEREMQILRLLSEGLSSEKIAKKLNISTHTVSTHRKQLLRKLEARNGAELIRKAQKLGILT